MVSLKHEKASKQFDCSWGKMVVRSFSYSKKKEEPKAEEDAKDRWGWAAKGNITSTLRGPARYSCTLYRCSEQGLVSYLRSLLFRGVVQEDVHQARLGRRAVQVRG